ncbi:MAG: helix-turn-helix transcriptional regulator [Candidatus Omnitrophica bacterium]|nr:helix-turn-helix transcriptional regulator [Candidatus Omnitrophota bacterium]
MENFYLLLGKKIREMRKERGLTQEELAWKSGISLNFMGQIERGHKKPSIKTLKKISETLGIAPSALFEEIKYAPPEEDLLIEKIKSLLKEGSEEDKKLIYKIVKSVLLKDKKKRG